MKGREDMPNYVENDLYVLGTADVRAAVQAALEGPEGVIDFNRVIPMPEYMLFTMSPPRVPQDGADPFEWAWVKDLGITDIEQIREHLLKRIREMHEAHPREDWDQWDRLCVTSKEARALAEYLSAVVAWQTPKTPDWHAWSIAKWGTKWNATRKKRYERSKSLLYKFDTAARWPKPVVVEIGRQHPSAKIVMRSYESGYGWKGELVIVNGAVVTEKTGRYRGLRGG